MEMVLSIIWNDYLLLTLVLVGAALFLKSWNPPMQRQYQFIALQGFSLLMVWLLEGIGTDATHFCYGFVITSLVFYGKEYLDAIKLIKEHEKVNHEVQLEDRIKYWELKQEDEDRKEK